MTHPHFSDFSEEDKVLDGDKSSIAKVLNQEILILNFRSGNRSKYKEGEEYTTIQFMQDGEKYVLFTGSEVLTDQLERYEKHLPFYATIVQINSYYTLT